MSGASMTAVLKQAERLFRDGTLAALTDDRLLGRFLDHGDEEAFAALVARHGPMVLGTCLDVLRDSNDAEDAFQATFLTLARRARSIRGRDCLGGWLRRVARRCAFRANAEARRRRRREQIAIAHAPTSFASAVAEGFEREELRRAIGDEIDRLPESYRRPVVLCLVEGLPQPEAAGRLQVSEGAIRGRLARAKMMLRERLTRRGVAPAPRPDSPIVPSAWVVAVLAAVRDLPARRAVLAGWAGASARVAAAVLVAASMATLAAGLTGTTSTDPPPPPPHQVPSTQPQVVAGQPVGVKPATPPPETVVLRGKILGPEGRPVAGARLYLIADAWSSPLERGVSGADGSYYLSLPGATFRRNLHDRNTSPRFQVSLIVAAEGLGAGWVDIGESPRRADAEVMDPEYVNDVHLPADYPIVGRVVDARGKPVAGAAVSVKELRAVVGGDWTPVFAAIKAGEATGQLDTFKQPPAYSWSRPMNRSCWTMIPAAATDADGRFRIAGVGRDRAIDLKVTGPGVRSTDVIVLTRDDVTELAQAMRDKYLKKRERDVAGVPGVALFDTSPTIEVAPGRTVAGVVVDARTGEPIPGVRVMFVSRSTSPEAAIAGTFSDPRGRFRGLRGESESSIWIYARFSQTDRYLDAVLPISNAGGAGEIVADFNIVRGVEVAGRVYESDTGRPILSTPRQECHGSRELLAGYVMYFPLAANTALRGTPTGLYFEAPPRGEAYYRKVEIVGDGLFRIFVPPGPGVLLVQASPGLPMNARLEGEWKESDALHRRFPYATLSARAKDDGVPGGDALSLPGFTGPISIDHCIAYKVINPPADAKALTVDFDIPRGPSRLLRFVDPSGRPIHGVTASGLSAAPWRMTRLEGSEVEAIGLDPARPREVVAMDRDGKLFARTFVGVDAQPMTIRLEPGGEVTGRLVDSLTGRPLVNYRTLFTAEIENYNLPRSADLGTTDADGRFTIRGLIHGIPASIVFWEPVQPGPNPVRPQLYRPDSLKDLDLRAGETRDLGDVRVATQKR